MNKTLAGQTMAHMKGRFVGSGGQVKIPVLGFRV